jgi:hypothetical protein
LQRNSAGFAPKCANNARVLRLFQTNRTAENGLLGTECGLCMGFSRELTFAVRFPVGP